MDNPDSAYNEQWVRPQASMSADDGLTAEFMYTIWQSGIIGMKEFRSWLANNFASFASIRDPGVDAIIDDVARNRFERTRYPAEESAEEPEYPDSM